MMIHWGPVEFWVLWAGLMVLIVIEVWLCAFAMLHVWATWMMKRDLRRLEARVKLYRDWSCPNCQQPFGLLSTWVYPDRRATLNDRREPFLPHVGITCPHCHFSNVFDESGQPMSKTGRFVDPEPARRELEFWKQIAPGLACPRCGTSYEGWGAKVWWLDEEPGVFNSPILRCRRCKAEADAVEQPEGTWIARVRSSLGRASSKT